MARLFGTDGVRGVAGVALTAKLALELGAAAAEVLTEASAKGSKKPLVVIGKDTRISSDMLESALAAGICSAGADVLLLGTIPTPAVAYLIGELKADAGVMISASHNPFGDNGIKIFGADGCKLPDEVEDQIEARMGGGFAPRTGNTIGRVRTERHAIQRYVDHLRSCATSDLRGLRILVDCANGAASVTSHELFDGFEAEVDIIADQPNGVNINLDCGSTHLDRLSRLVVAGGYDVGVAFDGDADRCLVVTEKGDTVDGDHIMAIVGRDMKRKGLLKNDTIVATVMSNLGFHKYAQANDLKVITAPVGDRYVLEEMKKGGYNLGGEQSGHLIFLDDATTGDGELTAIKYLGILAASGGKASDLDAEIGHFPQLLKNVRVPNELKHTLAEVPEVKKAIDEAEEMLGEGRILVRPSGTEPLVRVMTEGFDEDIVTKACEHVVRALEALNEAEA